MPAPFPNSNSRGVRAPVFATTQWSVVLQAGHDSGGETDGALETLCRSYWYPIHAYVRRLGHAPHDAQDMTQSFCALWNQMPGPYSINDAVFEFHVPGVISQANQFFRLRLP